MANNYVSNMTMYIEGISMKGQVSEIDLGELKSVMQSHEQLGKIGKSDVPVGFEQVNGSFTLVQADESVWANFCDPNKIYSIVILGPVMNKAYVPGSNGQIKYELRARPMNVGLGNIKNQDLLTWKREFCIDYVKLSMGGVEVTEYDYANDICKMMSSDIMAEFRALMGQ
jgi:P2 family phage contractile tail tube protein